MQWYDKFKVGQEVRVVIKVTCWKYGDWGILTWNVDMNKTIGKVYRIKSADKNFGYELSTEKDVYYKCNYWYPVESLEEGNVKGRQLLFNFMTE